MKKTLLSTLAGLAIITSASAMTKAECESLDMVYITKNGGDCIDKNPCKSDDYKMAYCNTDFADVQIARGQDRKLAEKWLTKRGYEVGPIIMGGSSEGGIDDYLAFKVNSGSDYIQFKFDDISESVESTKALGIAKGICRIYSGYVTDEAGSALTKVSVFCSNIKSEDVCNEMLSFYKEFENRVVLKSNYDSNRKTCQLYE